MMPPKKIRFEIHAQKMKGNVVNILKMSTNTIPPIPIVPSTTTPNTPYVRSDGRADTAFRPCCKYYYYYLFFG